MIWIYESCSVDEQRMWNNVIKGENHNANVLKLKEEQELSYRSKMTQYQ